MKKRNFLGRTLVLLILTGLVCAPAMASVYFTKHKGDERRAEPEEGHALVYVFRPATMGAAVKTWAFAGEDLMMVSKAKAYSFAQVPAGKTLLWTKSENTSALELDLEAGETYYLKVKIKMGINKARAKLMQVDAAEAAKYFAKCGYVEPTADGLARAAEIVANRLERAETKAAEAR